MSRFVNFDSWFEEVIFTACDRDRIVDIEDKEDFREYWNMGYDPEKSLDLWLEV